MHWQNLSQEQEVIAMLKIIHMKVNGKEHELAVDERESLLDTLRHAPGADFGEKGL